MTDLENTAILHQAICEKVKEHGSKHVCKKGKNYVNNNVLKGVIRRKEILIVTGPQTNGVSRPTNILKLSLTVCRQ